MATEVRLLIGTKKGAFVLTSDAKRETWQVSPPMFTGWSVLNMSMDTRRSTPRLYAGAAHWAWGPSVSRSDDFGKTWDSRSPGLGFPKDMEITVQNVWAITPGHESQPGVVFAGTQHAGLFRSEDWAESWAPVDGINRHETRKFWSGTGGGDSCLHSIEIDPADPKHMFVAVASGGSFETRDAGETWKMFHQTAIPRTPKALEFIRTMEKELPPEMTQTPRPDDIDPLAIDEMHKMQVDRKNTDRMWAQAHMGVFFSADAGKTWNDVTNNLPSFHGFPIAVTKSPPDAAYVVPLAFEGLYDNFRVADGQFAVYRTRNSGQSWEACTKGLPGPHDYQSVYREGLDTDGLDQEGVYVGTSNGEVYASLDGGDSWQRLPGTFPPILSVTAAVTN